MESAIFGLIGVIVGAALTTLKEWWFQRQKDKKEREYLVIQVSGQLERFVAGCVEVVRDDGTYHGQRDKNGECHVQVPAPTFAPETLNVEWKSLDARLMYEILDFPSRVAEADSWIESAHENAFPPDFDDLFEERQYQYAKLGLAASSLAARLRDSLGLPPRPAPEGHWDPLDFMRQNVSATEQKRKELKERHAPWHVVPEISTISIDGPH
jgi:hypothetical protein